MVTTRRYITETRYEALTGATVTNSTEWDRQASIAEELIDDVVGPQPPFHVDREIRVTTATTSTFETNSLNSDKDDYYNNLVVRIVEGTGKDQETRVSDYDGATGVFTMSPVLDTAPDENSVILIEQLGVFPRWTDSDRDGRPKNPEALERAVAYALAYAAEVGGSCGFNAAVFGTSGGKSSEAIGSYSVTYDLSSVNSQQQIGQRAYQILSNAGLIADFAIHHV